MSRRFGGLWIDLSGLDTDRIHRILEHGSGTFTVALPSTFLYQGTSSLALVSCRPKFLDYLAVVTASTRASDLETKVQIGPLRPFDTQINTDVLLSALSGRVRRFATPPGHRVTTVSPATWNALLEGAIALGGLPKDDLKALTESMESRSVDVRTTLPDAIAFERDAFATAFELLGGSTARKTYISSSVATSDAPFIKRLRHRDINVIEDTMIAHDALTFPGMTALQPHLVGAVRLSTTSGTLTILNANRTGIERTLGVDLVYYNHRYDSFTLVQYKRMRGDDNPVYRPGSDRNLEKELRRMRRFQRGSSIVKPTYETYRLLDRSFFLKLCKAHSPGDWNGRMLQGMYFPLQLWDLLVKSPAAKGPKGGIAIGFDGAKRRLTNSEFTQLLRKGWLGTNMKDTQRINDILVEQLAAGHSVVAAVHEPDRITVDYPRDSIGRFASEEDETAI